MKSLPLIAFTGLVLAFAIPELAAAEKPATVAEAPSEAKKDDREARPLTPQQQKMKNCNADAKSKDLHGDERRAFMSTCLKG